MTPEGERRLKDHEGLRLKPYRCTEDKLTIGYGRNLDAKGISHACAQLMFDEDMAEVAQQAASFSWFDSLDDVRRDVVTNLLFNMGLAGFHTFKRMIAAIERHDWAAAAWELSNSKWKSQVQKDRHDCLTHALEYGRWPT